MEPIVQIIIIVVIVGVIIGFIGFIIMWLSWRRRELLQKAATELGFYYEAITHYMPQMMYGHFPIFNIGRGQKGYNYMKGGFQGTEYEVFDYRYTLGGGRYARHYYQTYTIATVPSVNLPYFTLGPDTYYYKDGRKSKGMDIKIDTDDKFSKHYLLNTNDELRTRRIFNMQVISFFKSMKKRIAIEAYQDKIVLFRPAKQVKPQNLTDHLFEMASIVKVLTDACGSSYQS